MYLIRARSTHVLYYVGVIGRMILMKELDLGIR